MIQLEINNSLLTRLSNAGHLQLMGTIRNDAIKGNVDKIESLKQASADFSVEVQNEDDVYKKQQKFLETEDVESLDRRRDEVFSSIGAQMDAASKSAKPTIAEAGRQLANVYHKYRRAGDLRYDKETADISNLIEDLRLPENAERLKTLAWIASDVDDLEEVNRRFNEAYNRRNEKMQGELDKGTMKASRTKTDAQWMKLQQYINAVYVANELSPSPDADVRRTLEEAMRNITAYVNKASKGTRKKSGGDEPDPKPAVPELTVDAQRGAEAMPGAGFAFMDVFLVGADRKKLPALKETIAGAKVRLAFEATGDKMEAPVVDFVYYEEQPAGFRLGRPDGTAYYADPLEFLDEKQYATAEMYASDGHTLLCRFKKMKYPSVVRMQ
ncbi:MAG: DUF6261 family protein [Tannerella sp.]|jgi:hypothetical protein|nr:DUF6261 family protein [Tannerella sp.]